MKTYRTVTGGHDLRGFWKMSPAELFAWTDAIIGSPGDMFDDLEMGIEVED